MNVQKTIQRRAPRVIVSLVMVALAITAANAGLIAQSKTLPKTAAKPERLTITLKAQPAPAKVGDNQVIVTVKHADGKPVADADVSVLFVMPAMPAMKMGEMRNEVKLKPAGAGSYSGVASLMMGGTWNVTVSVKQAGQEIGQQKMTVTAK